MHKRFLIIWMVLLYAISGLLHAEEYTNTSYYVAYDDNDRTQFVLVMPSVGKVYTHKAGEILPDDLTQIDTQFTAFPSYNNGELCFPGLKEDASGSTGAEIMAGKCYVVNFFYTQKEIVEDQGMAFILTYTPDNKVYEGLAGISESFKVVRDGDQVNNENSISGEDYTLFTFDIAQSKVVVGEIIERSVEIIISPDNLTAEFENAKITFSENDIVKPEMLIISTKTVESLGEDINLEKELDSEFTIDYKMNIYDFSISKEDDFIDSINIIISYDDTLIDDSANEEDSVLAVYYNSEKNQYESELFTVDTEKNEVNITTTHLSPHGIVMVDRTKIGPFYVDTSREGTRSAKITGVSAYSGYVLSNESQAVDVLNELLDNDMTPGSAALEAGFGTSSAWLGLAASGNTIVGAGYSTEFLTSLSNAFNAIGVGASVLQAAIDFQNGDEQVLYTNLLKNTVYNTVNYLGTSTLQLAFVGVFFIDYSLNTFAAEALSLNEKKWKTVYDVCYNNDYKKSYTEWYSTFLKLSEGMPNPSRLNEVIENTVYNNVLSAWDESKLVECVDDAGYTGFLSLGGLTETMKYNISMEKKAELLNSFSPVFAQLGKKIHIDNQDSYKKNLEEIKDMLNQVISLTIETPVENGVAKYAGYTVKFASLNEYAKQDDWQGIVPVDGTVNTKFRLLGYMEVGSPDSIEIYDTNNIMVEKIKLGTISPSMLLTIDTEEDNVAYETCPLTFSSNLLYMDLDNGVSYTDYSVVSELELNPDNWFTCTYNVYYDSLYYTSYYQNGELTLQEEWYPDGNCGSLPAQVKYRLDYVSGRWIKYGCTYDDDGFSYIVTDSGSL